MFSKLFGMNRNDPDNLKKLLAQGRRHLWHRNLAKANESFQHVMDRVDTNSTDDTTHTIRMQAKLGLWATTYLENASVGDRVQTVLDRDTLDSSIAFFIAKVFQMNEDTTPTALTAYQRLLEHNPSEKIMYRIAKLLTKAPATAQKASLLNMIYVQVPEDVDLAGDLCRVYMSLEDYQHKAQDVAYEIILLHPEHQDANRTLAVIAEREGDWERAATAYQHSHDYLRQGIVLLRADSPQDAAVTLDMATTEVQETNLWRYYRGWAAFHLEKYEVAIQLWSKVEEGFPTSESCAPLIATAQDRLVLAGLDKNSTDLEQIDNQYVSTTYRPYVEVAIEFNKILAGKDTEAAHTRLKQSAMEKTNDVVFATLYLLAYAILRDDVSKDDRMIRSLSKHFRNATLFQWLRGVHLLHSDPEDAHEYLSMGRRNEVYPDQAIHAVEWMLLYKGQDPLSDDDVTATIESELLSPSDFASAIFPVYLLAQIEQGQSAEWVLSLDEKDSNSKVAERVYLAYHVAHQEWISSLSYLLAVPQEMETRIVDTAIHTTYAQENWAGLVCVVQKALELELNVPHLQELDTLLRPQWYHTLWQDGDLDTLDLVLERQVHAGKASTITYHGLALVYTQFALKKDARVNAYEGDDPESVFRMNDHRTPAVYMGILEDQPHNDFWQLAIGYWAVALTDDEFWQTWRDQRSTIYGEDIDEADIAELRQLRILKMLSEHHQEQIHTGSPFTSHHRFYNAIAKREIESTNAVRYLLRTSQRQNFSLPHEFENYISPLLMREYGYEEKGQHIVDKLVQFKLSPYEAQQIRSAFSPLSDIRALIDLREFDMAFTALRQLVDGESDNDIRTEAEQELAHVLELAIPEYIENERWQTAQELMAEAKRLQPLNERFRHLNVQVVLGSARQHFVRRDYQKAVDQLEALKGTQSADNDDVSALLGEAYQEWASEAVHEEDDLELARQRLENAHAILPNDQRISNSLGAVHHDLASRQLNADNLQGAYTQINKALGYLRDPQILTLAAIIFHDLARQNDRSDLSRKSYDTAHERFQLTPDDDSLRFFVELGINHAAFLWTEKRFSEAIEVAESLLQWRVDFSSFNINIYKMLSGIYTDYGADAYNAGNRYQGRQLTEKAIEYDPSNTAARNNLYQM